VSRGVSGRGFVKGTIASVSPWLVRFESERSIEGIVCSFEGSRSLGERRAPGHRPLRGSEEDLNCMYKQKARHKILRIWFAVFLLAPIWMLVLFAEGGAAELILNRE
jgi:hypothetical protein